MNQSVIKKGKLKEQGNNFSTAVKTKQAQ